MSCVFGMLQHLQKRGYNRRMADKPKLTIIHGTPAPDTPLEQRRKRLRKTKVESIPQCPRCAGRTYLTIQTHDTKQRVCYFCSMKGEMVVMS